MSWAYVNADIRPLWPGLRLLPLLVMPVAFVLLACGLLVRNPTLVGAEGLLKKEDPARGVVRVTRHPIMWGIMLWAAAHMLARGEANALVFFGGFLALGLIGTLAMDQRKARTLGEDWARFAAVTSHVPFAAILAGRNRFVASEIGWIGPLAGLVLFAALFAAHSWLFGARPY